MKISIERNIVKLPRSDSKRINEQYQKMSGNLISENNIAAVENKIRLLLAIKDAKRGYQEAVGKLSLPGTNILKGLEIIDEAHDFVLKDRNYFTTQEISDIMAEMKKIKLLLGLTKVKEKAKQIHLEFDESFKDKIKTAETYILEMTPFNMSRQTFVQKLIKTFEKLIPKSGLGITDEEKVQIVGAMQLSKGHWYKCPRGHVYAIGDCGGATEESVCPECKTRIGGTQHRLRTDNAVATEMDGARYPAWSEQNNMENYDPFQIRYN